MRPRERKESVEFGQKRSHLRSGKSRSYYDSSERVTDETDPFGIEIIALQIAEDLRYEPVGHCIECAECSTLFIDRILKTLENYPTRKVPKERERIKL